MANVLCPVETHRLADPIAGEPALGFERRGSNNTPRILSAHWAVADEGIVQPVPKGMEHLSRRLHHLAGVPQQ